MTKYLVTIESSSGKFVQEHIVSRKAADTICNYVINHGYKSFSDVKSIEVQPYV